MKSECYLLKPYEKRKEGIVDYGNNISKYRVEESFIKVQNVKSRTNAKKKG